MERQLENKFRTWLIDHQQNEMKKTAPETESKVEKKFERILLDNTAKFKSVFDYLQNQN